MEIRRLFLKQRPDVHKEWVDFLNQSNIKEEKALEYTCGIYENDKLIATGSYYGNIIKCVAISKDMRGGTIFNTLISHLMEEIISNGDVDCYVYTKPSLTSSFEHLGFKKVAQVDDVLVFLERSINGIEKFKKFLNIQKEEGNNNSAIVMNANPFTKGHLHLIETASLGSSELYVFVVEEESSEFPFDNRIKLVKEGCKDLKNVKVMGTGNYMVSSKTFPSYFIEESENITEIQAKLDAIIFKDHIAPVLNIGKRFVGQEPISLATNIYNMSLKEILEPEIELIVIPRKEFDGDYISASRVRKLMSEGNIEDIKPLVPPATYNFLNSREGEILIKSIQTRRKYNEQF